MLLVLRVLWALTDRFEKYGDEYKNFHLLLEFREARYDGARGGLGGVWGCLCLSRFAFVNSRLERDIW